MKIKHIRSIVIALLCVVLLTGCGAEKNNNAASQNENINFGKFAANTLEGDKITNEYFAKEKLTLINVWATFCGPCKMEIPVLGDLDRELEDFQVMGIVMDVLDQDGNLLPEQIETAKKLNEVSNADYPSAIINESLAQLGVAGLTSFPTSIFVDSEGNIVGDLVVGARDEAGWREIIEERMEAVK